MKTKLLLIALTVLTSSCVTISRVSRIEKKIDRIHHRQEFPPDKEFKNHLFAFIEAIVRENKMKDIQVPCGEDLFDICDDIKKINAASEKEGADKKDESKPVDPK